MKVEEISIVAFLVFYLSWEASAASVAGTGPYKCGSLECPIGSFCEIKRKPSDDEKTVTVTTQCIDSEDKVLQEDTATEDIPEGTLPVASVSRKIIKESDGGAFYGSSYAGSFVHGNLTKLGENATKLMDAELIDFDDEDGLGSYFDKVWTRQREIFNETTGRIREIFKNFW